MMNQKNELTFKAGDTCLKTGQYDIVDENGKILFSTVSVVRGKRFPKLTEENQGYKLYDVKKNAGIVHFLMGYFIVILLFSFWLLLDIWASNFSLFRMLGLNDKALEDELIRTIGFSITGGLIGSVLYNIRKLFHYYARLKRFDQEWAGKYISAPWEGAGLGLVVLALIRGGVTVFGGPTDATIEPVTNFAAFGVGSLVGFGMRDVVGWMGSLIQTMFSFQKVTEEIGVSGIDSESEDEDGGEK